ncbi:MAG TPA: hypothetical protein VLT33_33255 [Labilithrix sp.]|nr:hypothetical protein [Labilithrix sp.]
MRRLLLLVGPFAPVAVFAGLAALAACGSSSATGGPPGGEVTDAGGAEPDGEAPAVDNGAPSTTYPAPHPPLPDLVNAAKGPVLTTPKVAFVFYPGDARASDLEAFARKVAGSTYWSTTTAEYGVGALSYAGMFELTGETAPTTISQAQIQTKVASDLASGKLGVPDPQTIYTLVFPTGTTVTQENPVSTLLGPVLSCEAFTGYHDNVAVALGDAGAKTEFAYAVIPTCAPDVTSLTSVMSHEWVEAATDPQLTSNGLFSVTGGPNAAFYAPDRDHTVWSLLGGGEAGDLCAPSGPSIEFTPPEIGFPVQRTWSNVAARASHDPCVPHVAGAAYFAAAPVLTQTVTFSTSFTGSVTTKGMVIAVGASATVEVDLFSDGALDGPITVKAADLLNASYGSYGFAKTLAFAWDRTQGVNGEKLHLKVTVTDSSFLGGAHAFTITAVNGKRRQVWPGLVVEQ